MTAQLPSWVVEPIDRIGAAKAIGVSPRTLTDILKTCPFYEKRGNKKVFYPEHIAKIREALTCQNSGSKSAATHGTPMAPSPETAFDKALALATEAPQKNSGRNSKRGSGNVTRMARKR